MIKTWQIPEGKVASVSVGGVVIWQAETQAEQLTAPTISLDGDTLTMTATDDRTEQFVIFVDGVETATVENEEELTPTEGLAYTLSDDGTYYVCAGIGTATDTDIVIASEIDGIPVTLVKGFKDNTLIKSVTIPNSVRSIDQQAFRNCTLLGTIVIGNSVRVILYYAFANTAYYNNESNWTDNVLYIGNYLIAAKDNSLGNYIVKDGTLCIGSYGFKDCASLTSISIPNSVRDIDIQAFKGCTSLTSLVIPDSVTRLRSGLCHSCSSLKNVTIGVSIERIEANVFFECTLLENISFTGTKEQWNAISKGSNWNYSVPATYVQCTDGTVSI